MKKHALFLVFLLILLSVSSALATDMVFTNGFWSSSYSGCSDDILSIPVSSDLETLDPSCTDLGGLIVPFGSNIYTCDNPEHTASSQIRSEASFPGGSGKRGFRQYIGFSGDPGADYTAYQSLEFPSGVTDVWIRYYERRSATTSGSRFGDTKDIYFHGTNCGVMAFHAFNYTDGYRLAESCGQSLDIKVTNGAGLQTLLGQDEFDGNWHSVEVHIASHASTIDFQFWLDGILMDEQMNAPLNFGELITADLWQSKKGNTGQCETIDHDDIAVATPSYTGFVKDAHGNDMIGPIGWGGGAPDVNPPVISNTYPSGTIACSTPTIAGWQTDENARCKWDTSDVAYDAMVNTADETNAQIHRLFNAFACAQTHTVYVACADGSGNESDNAAINFTLEAASAGSPGGDSDGSGGCLIETARAGLVNGLP